MLEFPEDSISKIQKFCKQFLYWYDDINDGKPAQFSSWLSSLSLDYITFITLPWDYYNT